ncbi:DNA/RNA helicase domain-containing protein [Lentibacillus amyloliquefaciens]|uniref:DNA/RNA helicase domain-containing protein n=1 Tax=Lentibacillus amyloliquefaciens TaxID=1472767 RepID=UPI000AEE1404|nr:DNA/RNA helicase domain-containing protein [Lentibacillus amyloliquefaciens]
MNFQCVWFETQSIADDIIHNTYRTLMTRGQKGCFVFCTVPELNKYFQSRLNKTYEYNDFSPGKTDMVAENKGFYH